MTSLAPAAEAMTAPPGAVARATRGWRPWALLTLLCLALYLPGIVSLPPFDRDEARFAQATRQMLASGDFLHIRFQDEARNRKPAGIYWLQAAAVGAFSNAASTAIWPYRLPSLAGALGAVLLTFGLGARIIGRSPAFLGAALLATSLALVGEAHLAKTDAVLCALVVAAQGALGTIYCRHRRSGTRAGPGWALLFWIAEGTAVLIKGPVAPLLAVLTIAALGIADRELRWLAGLRAWWGAPLGLAIFTPWLIAISIATQGAFLDQSIGQDFLAKLIGAQESHGAPPLYYLALLILTFWPGSLFLGSAAAAAWRGRHAPAERFLMAWAVPFWFVLELVPTKLPHYLLPAYPALALLAGQALSGLGAARRPHWLDRAFALLWAAVSLVLAGFLMIVPLGLGRGIDAAGIVAGAVILFFGARLVIAAWRGLAPGLAGRVVLLGLLVLPAVLGIEAPTLDRLWLSRSAAELVALHPPPPGGALISVGYSEPSLVFLLGTATRLISAAAAAEQMAAAPGSEALVESREDTAFRAALKAHRLTARPLGAVAGLDYSNGKRMVLRLYRAVPQG